MNDNKINSTESSKSIIDNQNIPQEDGVPATFTPKQVYAKKTVGKKRSKGKIALIAVVSVICVLGIVLFAGYSIIQNRIAGQNTQAGTLPEGVGTDAEFKGDTVSFLVCGIKFDNENGKVDDIGNTDMFLYVRYNIVDGALSIMQFPRDVYVGDEVETGQSSLDPKERQRYKLNALYRHSLDPDNKMAPIAQVFKEQFGLPVDFYVTLDIEALVEIVNIKGSIKMYVPMTVSDPESPEAHIEQGWRWLDGKQVEFLLRNRKSPTYNQQGDIARLRTQQSFYSAIFREFKTLSGTDLAMWMNILMYRCKTDANGLQLVDLADKARKLEATDITFIRPPVSPVEYNGEALVSLRPEETVELINKYFLPKEAAVSLEELEMHSLPEDPNFGTAEAEVKTMADVQATEAAEE